MDKIESMAAKISRLRPARYFGSVVEIRAGLVRVSGLNAHASIGDRVLLSPDLDLAGEIVALGPKMAEILPDRR